MLFKFVMLGIELNKSIYIYIRLFNKNQTKRWNFTYTKNKEKKIYSMKTYKTEEKKKKNENSFMRKDGKKDGNFFIG